MRSNIFHLASEVRRSRRMRTHRASEVPWRSADIAFREMRNFFRMTDRNELFVSVGSGRCVPNVRRSRIAMTSLEPSNSEENAEHAVVKELVLPNLLHEFPARLAGVNREVRSEDDDKRGEIHARINECDGEEADGVHENVVGHHFPAFPLFHRHPWALKSEVADMVRCNKKQTGEREANRYNGNRVQWCNEPMKHGFLLEVTPRVPRFSRCDLDLVVRG